MIKLLRKLPRWTLTVIVSVMILYLTLVPEPVPDDISFGFQGIDKVVHGIMFAALAGAIVVDWHRREVSSSRNLGTTAVIASVISSLAGGAIELLQREMALGRGCEFIDFVADAIGACIGASVGVIIVRWLRKQ